MTFYTHKPRPELVTACGATADPSTHCRGIPLGVGSRLLGHKTLKSGFIGQITFVLYTIGVSPALQERLLPLDEELPLGILLLGTPCRL